MNEEFNNYLKKAGEKISLTREERERMRAVIHRYMELKPVRSSRKFLTWNLGGFLFMRPIAIGLAVFVLFSSAGLSYAAGNTLPGDFLYSIKTKVNEPLTGLLAISTTAKTEWAMGVAEERIKEATVLAAGSRLNAEVQRKIEADFEEHARVAIDNIEAKASTEPELSAEAAARFEARLSEYGRILAEVGAAKNVATDDLTVSIRAKQDHVSLVRVDAETDIRTSENQERGGSVTASKLRNAAKEKLVESSKRSRNTSRALSTSSAENIALEIENTSATIATGESLLQKDDAREAIGAFRGALSASEKVDVFLKTSAAINKRTGLMIGEPSQAQASSLSQKRDSKKKERSEKGEQDFSAQVSIPQPTLMQSAKIESEEPKKDEVEKQKQEEIRIADQSEESKEDSESSSTILRVGAPVSGLPDAFDWED